MQKTATTEENKVVYRRFIQEIFNEGRLERLNDLVSPSYTLRDAPPGTQSGPEAIRQIVLMFREGFPDLHITLEELVAEGKLVAARSTFRGTHHGTIFGLKPTGKKVSMPGLTMVHIVEGKLVESWVRNDVMGLMRQLESQS